MEQHGASPGDDYRTRPVFERYGLSELFTYARDNDRWIDEWVTSHQRSEARSNLAMQLDEIVHAEFSQQPHVTVYSERVYRPLNESRNKEHLIASTQVVPLQDDAAMLGEHTIEGTLHGFSVVPHGDSTELIAYIRRSEPIVYLRTGQYVPLWSVPVRDAAISFSEQLRQQRRAELRRELGGRVLAMEHEKQYEINDALRRMIDALGHAEESKTERICHAGQYMDFVLQTGVAPNELTDAMFDIVSFELNLRQGVSIETTAHRLVTTDQAVHSYRRGGGARFVNVKPELCVMGESLRRFAGLTFYSGDTVVQTGIRDIVSLE